MSVQPRVQDPDHVIETAGTANGGESLTAADSAEADKSMEGGEGKLRLRERQPSLVA